MPLPFQFYRYSGIPDLNKNIGGLAAGPEFTVEAGKTYPIEILIGEIPGGYFSVSLFLETIGADYQKRFQRISNPSSFQPRRSTTSRSARRITPDCTSRSNMEGRIRRKEA